MTRKAAVLPLACVLALAAGGCWESPDPAPPPEADGVADGTVATAQTQDAGPADGASDAASPPREPERPARYWSDRANLERAHGFRMEALELYQKALDGADEALRSSVLYQYGGCLRELDRVEEAADALRESYRLSDGDARRRAAEALADVLDGLGRDGEALEFREEILLERAAADGATRPGAADVKAYAELVRRRGLAEKAIQDWEDRLAREPRNDFVRQVLVELYVDEDPVKAAGLMRSLIEARPGDMHLRSRLAMLYQQAGMLADAEREFESMAQDFPAHRSKYLEQLASLRVDQGNRKGAAEVLDRLQQEGDLSGPTLVRMASMFASVQHFDQAEQCFRDAVQTGRSILERQRYERYLVDYLVTRGKYDEAEVLLNNILAAPPAGQDVEDWAQKALQVLRKLRKP